MNPEDLALPRTWDDFMAALESQRQAQWEAAVLDVTDATLGRMDEWHDDCPALTFVRILRNDEDFQRNFIRICRERREG